MDEIRKSCDGEIPLITSEITQTDLHLILYYYLSLLGPSGESNYSSITLGVGVSIENAKVRINKHLTDDKKEFFTVGFSFTMEYERKKFSFGELKSVLDQGKISLIIYNKIPSAISKKFDVLVYDEKYPKFRDKSKIESEDGENWFLKTYSKSNILMSSIPININNFNFKSPVKHGVEEVYFLEGEESSPVGYRFWLNGIEVDFEKYQRELIKEVNKSSDIIPDLSTIIGDYVGNPKNNINK